MPHSALRPWRLVIPVKGVAGAKSRLVPPRGVSRGALAEAMARDTAAAAARSMPVSQVFVVAGDERVAQWAAALGVTVVADPGGGLNAAVAAGVAAAAQPLAGAQAPAVRAVPGGAGRSGSERTVAVAVLLGDVPALRPGDLAAGLGAAAAYDLAFVPDADGTGTVLLTALDAATLQPRFGPESARRHEDAGHRRLDLALPRLRTDVDDAASLARGAALGLGPRTAGLLAGARRPAG